MRIHGKRDSTHKAIVAQLRCFGASVFDAGDVGCGFPDLVVGFAGKTYLIECKDAKGKLTEDQESFVASWKGSEVTILRSASDAALWVLEQRRKGAKSERENDREEPAQGT